MARPATALPACVNLALKAAGEYWSTVWTPLNASFVGNREPETVKGTDPVDDGAKPVLPAKLAETVDDPDEGAVTMARAMPLVLLVVATLVVPSVSVTGTPAIPTPPAFTLAERVTRDPAGALLGPRYRVTVVIGETGAGCTDTLWARYASPALYWSQLAATRKIPGCALLGTVRVADHVPSALGTTAATSTGTDSSLIRVASTDRGTLEPFGIVQSAPETVVELPGLSPAGLTVMRSDVGAVTATVTGA
jgi:hypothetical protein